MVFADHVVLFHHLRRILEAASVAGIDVAPLKGAHLATAVYSEGEHRAMGDVDFLVRPRDWEKTLALMASLGFSRRPIGRDEGETHEVGFHLDAGLARPLLYEAHRYLLDPARFPIDHGAVWDRSRSSDLDGAPCRRLSAEDSFAHTALHSAAHSFQQIRRAARDAELLLERGGADPDEIGRVAREWRATRSVWLIASLVDGRRPDLGLSPLVRSLAPPLGARLVLGALVTEGGGSRLDRLPHRIRASILWPIALDGPAAVARAVLNHPELARLRRGAFSRR